MLAQRNDGEVFAARTRSQVSNVDALRHRRREVDQVAATPWRVDARDDELDALVSVDEVAHGALEVALVGRRVAEPKLVGVEHVASPHVDAHTHVRHPAGRPHRHHELVDEIAYLREELEVMTQPLLGVARVLPALEEPGQEDGLAASFRRPTTVDQILQTIVVRQGLSLAEHVARTEIDEALDTEVEDFLER